MYPGDEAGGLNSNAQSGWPARPNFVAGHRYLTRAPKARPGRQTPPRRPTTGPYQAHTHRRVAIGREERGRERACAEPSLRRERAPAGGGKG